MKKLLTLTAAVALASTAVFATEVPMVARVLKPRASTEPRMPTDSVTSGVTASTDSVASPVGADAGIPGVTLTSDAVARFTSDKGPLMRQESFSRFPTEADAQAEYDRRHTAADQRFQGIISETAPIKRVVPGATPVDEIATPDEILEKLNFTEPKLNLTETNRPDFIVDASGNVTGFKKNSNGLPLVKDSKRAVVVGLNDAKIRDAIIKITTAKHDANEKAAEAARKAKDEAESAYTTATAEHTARVAAATAAQAGLADVTFDKVVGSLKDRKPLAIQFITTAGVNGLTVEALDKYPALVDVFSSLSGDAAGELAALMASLSPKIDADWVNAHYEELEREKLTDASVVTSYVTQISDLEAELAAARAELASAPSPAAQGLNRGRSFGSGISESEDDLDNGFGSSGGSSVAGSGVPPVAPQISSSFKLVGGDADVGGEDTSLQSPPRNEKRTAPVTQQPTATKAAAAKAAAEAKAAAAKAAAAKAAELIAGGYTFDGINTWHNPHTNDRIDVKQ